MSAYHIGTEGAPWGDKERGEWRNEVNRVKRSYQDEVVAKLDILDKSIYEVSQYGSLGYIEGGSDRYKLFYVKSKNWDAAKPTVLVTGGVHGYETSGVQGALLFLSTVGAETYSKHFNIVCCPCVSPWGYECIQRWNYNAEDPNRGFFPESSREECASVMALIDTLGGADKFIMHIDLHETTDTDETEFRPAKMARDGLPWKSGTIPDGFYLVGDEANPQHEWHKAIIDSVRKVTHIAPPDADGEIIGKKPSQEGVIHYPTAELFLCSSLTKAPFCTTTEVYPDSPKANDEQCNRAQVAAVTGALDYVLDRHLMKKN
jgi:hypothetical protein